MANGKSRAQTNGIAAVAGALVGIYSEVGIIGQSFVTQLCDAARKAFKGKAIATETIEAIVEECAAKLGWEGRSGSSRKAEAKVLLRNYAMLPEAVEAFMPLNKGRCNWHNVVQLARFADKNPKLKAASVASKVAENNGGGEGPTDPKSAKKAAAMRVKKILELKHLDAKFKKALRVLCAEHNLNV